jgi:orotate phosphoribosyltransferase
MQIPTDDEYYSLYFECKEYIDKNCIVRDTRMPGKAPGTWYSWIFYMRRGLLDRAFMSAISKLFIYRINQEIGHFDFQIAGLETGATPLVVALPIHLHRHKIDVHSFSIRKEKKKYGLLNWIEGVPNDKPVLLVDDLCNSSMSMRQAYNVLKEEGIPTLPWAFSVVNKYNHGVHDPIRGVTDMYLPHDMRVVTLFRMDDFNLKNPSH